MLHFLPSSDTGFLFNIQRFSIHDGPGIRTTLFFGGCPLTCPWCCNPESMDMGPALFHDRKRCAMCGLCSQVCPSKAISIKDGRWAADLALCAKTCSSWGRCAKACPQDALEFVGQAYGLGQLAEEVEKDQAFFDKSKGGVTYSGGEVLMQVDFVEKLSARLRKKGVNIACETSASLPLPRFQRLLEAVDYVMVDVKHYQGKTLWETCRADHQVICGNIQEAARRGIPMAARIPVIPGFNASMEDMEGFARLGKELGIREFHLLPFHQLGEEKYERLQKAYMMKGMPPLHKEDVAGYGAYLKAQGFRVKVGG